MIGRLEETGVQVPPEQCTLVIDATRQAVGILQDGPIVFFNEIIEQILAWTAGRYVAIGLERFSPLNHQIRKGRLHYADTLS